jgi:hypothetical protein
MKLKHISMQEMPLGKFDTTGDFDKGSSFRDPKDRKMISNPRFKEIVAKKFKNTYYTINMFFVNNRDANQHTEVGGVDLDWVRDNLGGEVADKVAPTYQNESEVNIIYTNNKGAQRVNMTPWIIAHRMGHAFARFKQSGGRGMERQFRSYKEVVEEISRQFEMIFQEVYGIKSFKSDKITGPTDRRDQLLMKHLSHNIATFKSARDKNMREYFELYNELFAQYVITGKVTLKDLPTSFKAGKDMVHVRDKEAYEELKELGSLERTLEYYFDEMMSEAESYILVM